MTASMQGRMAPRRHAQAGGPSGARFAGPLLLATLLVAGVGCTTRRGAESDAPLPLVSTSPVPQPDENIQALVVTIVDSRFDSDVYTQQTGATRMVVKTHGGPYLFSIDDLADRRELPASGTTEILYSISDPGRHTMRADLSTSTAAAATHATATLDVRPVGGR
jgi:hypothetical protein